MDEEDIGVAADLEGAKTVPMGSEYLYDPKFYRSLSGGRTRNLRHNLDPDRETRGDVEVRPYTAGDVPDCLALLDEWWEMQKTKHEQLYNRRYNTACLKTAAKFDQADLFGKVILVDGKIRSFGFAGEMREGLGNLFITYSDHNIKGLNYFLYLSSVSGYGKIRSCQRWEQPTHPESSSRRRYFARCGCMPSTAFIKPWGKRTEQAVYPI